VENCEAKKYLENLVKCQKVQNNKSLFDKFSYIRSSIVNLLSQMLQFNPKYRMSTQECLALPIFDHIREKSLEEPAPFKIHLDIDRPEFI
jgi:serine/threonine protein kinase